MLDKANRLTKHGSFNFVYRKGEKLSTPGLRMAYFICLGKTRVGFVVSNKLGKAVRRNLIKRRLRYAMRKFITQTVGAQIVFTATDEICNLEYEQIEARMKQLLTRANILK